MMRRLWSVVALGVALGAMVAGEEQRGRSAGGPPAAKSGDARDSGVTAEVHVSFSSAEIQILRDHYRPKYRNLPPGLQKKVARGGQLPPGWQKKMEPFPPELERRLSRLPSGHQRGVFDGHAVVSLPGGVIIDAAVLF